MWKDDFESQGPTQGSDNNNHGNDNYPRLIAVGLIIAVAVFLASFMPPAIFPAVVSNVTYMAALVFGMMAIFRRETFFGERISGWDQMLLLLFVSTGSGLFIDAEAVATYLEEAAS